MTPALAMRHFCTYFDQRYLTRGLLVYDSLRRHCGAFQLWALCLDEAAHRTLIELDLPGITPLRLAELEAADPALALARRNRSTVEYYFTCTPSLPRYILNQEPSVDLITYLDADLYFYSDPEPLFEELGDDSIAIIGHRYPPELRRAKEPFGIYNVGWLTFRRDARGLACLEWWRERCLEWCFQRLEPGRYCDQKYLDDWPARFPGVKVLEHRGANVALWNVGPSHVAWDGERVRIDGAPLVFFHFHSVRNARRWLFHMNASDYGFVPRGAIVRHVFTPYVRALQRKERQIQPLIAAQRESATIGRYPEDAYAPTPRIARLFQLAWRTIGRLVRRDCMIVVNGRLLELPALPRRRRVEEF